MLKIKEQVKYSHNPNNLENKEIRENYSKKLRASYYFMGALLGKYKKAVMYFPGAAQ